MQINAYLNFDGQCREAFDFYGRVLGGTVKMMTMEESPMGGQVGPEWKGRIMHARLEVGDQAIMASDTPPGQPPSPQGMWVSIQVPEPAEAERIYNALLEGGRATMPMQETFWAPRFGMLVDRYGTPWMVGCDASL